MRVEDSSAVYESSTKMEVQKTTVLTFLLKTLAGWFGNVARAPLPESCIHTEKGFSYNTIAEFRNGSADDPICILNHWRQLLKSTGMNHGCSTSLVTDKSNSHRLKGSLRSIPTYWSLILGGSYRELECVDFKHAWMKDLSFGRLERKSTLPETNSEFSPENELDGWKKRGWRKNWSNKSSPNMLEHIHHGSFKIYPAQNICIFWVAKRSTWPEVFHPFRGPGLSYFTVRISFQEPVLWRKVMGK